MSTRQPVPNFLKLNVGKKGCRVLQTSLKSCGKLVVKGSGVCCVKDVCCAYSFTGEARCGGCLCTSLGWFKHVEPPRTCSNHKLAELARCVACFHLSSGWCSSTELALTTALQEKQGVQGVYALVRGGSSTANLLEPSRTTGVQTRQGVLRHVEPPRTYTNQLIAETTRCVEFFSNHIIAFTRVRGGSALTNRGNTSAGC